jgi:hypothetical protein
MGMSDHGMANRAPRVDIKIACRAIEAMLGQSQQAALHRAHAVSLGGGQNWALSEKPRPKHLTLTEKREPGVS